MRLNNRLKTFIGLVLLLIWASTLSAAPKSELIPFWNKSNPANKAKIDHSAWQFILNRYLSSMQRLNPRKYSKAEQKAYWINLYNALTVKVILDNYPVKSITKIHEGWDALT